MIEEPPYTLVSQTKSYEIRHYEDTFVAETTIQAEFENAGSKAFKRLASYIFGNNASQIKIAMTAPVTQEALHGVDEKAKEPIVKETMVQTLGGYRVHFTMPRQFTIATLPQPQDPRVHLLKIPARKVAVFKYSGSWSQVRFQKMLKTFMSDLNRDKIETLGEPIFARFNSPFQIWFLRRNEIWLNLKAPD